MLDQAPLKIIKITYYVEEILHSGGTRKIEDGNKQVIKIRQEKVNVDKHIWSIMGRILKHCSKA